MNIKKFAEYVGALSTVKRFSQSTMCVPESVLEHTGAAALICMFIGRGLIDEGHKIDMGILLEKALIHDFDEIASGDIARPVKYHSAEMRQLFHEFEKENMESICIDFSGVKYKSFFNIWCEAKEGTEGKIVKIADHLCVFYKIHNEIVMRGNLTMLYYFNISYRVKIEKLFKSLDESIRAQYVDSLQSDEFYSGFLKQSLNETLKILIEIEAQK